jgi:hypothetical protein
MQACDGMTLAEAAIRLGTTPDAVRKRIKRGTLQGYKADGGRWLVRLNGAGHGPDTDSQVDDERVDAAGRRVDGEVDADTLAAYRELVATLQAELAAVRAELIRHDQLLAVALQRVPALPTPAQQVSAQEPVPRYPWWQFWRRSKQAAV